MKYVTRLKQHDLSERQIAYLFIAPAILIILLVNIYPMFNAVALSFQHENLLDDTKTGFAGLYNYIDILKSPDFWNSVKVTFYFAAVSITFQLVLGTLIALLLNMNFKGRGVVRALILIPWAIPTLVNASLWNWIFNANYGALNRLLMQFGLIDSPVLWMNNAKTALNMLIVADSWHMLPLSVIMMLAALQIVDESTIQASIIDGANAFQRFIHIKLPVMSPLMLVLLIMRTTQTLKVFDIIYMTTNGGPGNGTMAISFYIYFEIFKNLNYGRGAALSMLMALIVLGIAIAYKRMLKENQGGSQ